MQAVFNYQDLFLSTDCNGDTCEPFPNLKLFSETEKSDYDCVSSEVVLIQEFNKTQWKDFSSKLRQNSPKRIGHCGHEWDCCGCLSGQSMGYEYIKKGVFKITFSQSFNY